MSNESLQLIPDTNYELMDPLERAFLSVDSLAIPEFDSIESGSEAAGRELFLAKRYQESADALIYTASQYEEHGYLLKAASCLEDASRNCWYLGKLELEELLLVDAIGLAQVAYGLTMVATENGLLKPIRAQYPNLNRLWWKREKHPEEGTPTQLISSVLYGQYIELIRTQSHLYGTKYAKQTYQKALERVPTFNYEQYAREASVLSVHELETDTARFRYTAQYFL